VGRITKSSQEPQGSGERPLHVDCTQCNEALSARLDGEESAADRDMIDVHLASCAACRWFADEAARVTRLVRTAVATQEPNVLEAVLAAVPRSRRPHLVTILRVLLGLVGLAQVEVAVVELLGAHASGDGSQGVVLQGASITHFAHESVAWNLALGVGFLWIAKRSSRTSGMVPTLATFMTVLTVLVVMDAVAGGVDAARLLAHGLILIGLILVILLDRLPRPAGGTVPGTPVLRRRRSELSGHVDPAIGTDADDLPPDLRPIAQHDDTVITQRWTA
jgi:predicted anti-sigma-YlaC factor YlaD